MILITVFIFFIPSASYGEDEYYTIQAATYLTIIDAEKNYDLLYNGLSEEDKDYLRVELIKDKYYTLRIGKFDSYHKALPLLEKVKEIFPSAYIMKAYIKDNRIKRMYIRDYSAEKDHSRLEEKLEMTTKEKQEQQPQPQVVAPQKEEKVLKKTPRKIPLHGEGLEKKKRSIIPYLLAGLIAVGIITIILKSSPSLFKLKEKIPKLVGNEKRIFNADISLKDIDKDSVEDLVDKIKERIDFIVDDVGLHNLPDNIEYMKSDEDSVLVFRELKRPFNIKKNLVVLSSTAIIEGSTIKGDLFIKGDAELQDNVTVFSLFSEGEINTGRGVKCSGILYAEGSINIGENSSVDGLIYTDAEIVLNRGVFFKKIYGRPVRTYNYRKETPQYDYSDLYSPHIDELPFPIKSLKNTIWFTKEDFIVPERVRIHKNLVTNATLTISKGSIIHGYVKANKDIYLGSNVSINGDVIAYKDIYIGENVRIYGDIFARGKVHLDRGARVGGRARVVHITTNSEITISEDVEIYGMVKSKKGVVI